MTRLKIIRGILTINQPSVLFVERGRKCQLTVGKKSFDEFRIIIVDPNPELDSEESNTYSSYFGISSENSIK